MAFEFSGGSKRVSNLASSAFNDNITVGLVPFVVASPVYNLIPANFRSFTFFSGSTEASDRVFKCFTGTTQFGYGAIQSFRSLNYRPGEGALVRFGARFPSNVASGISGVGLFTVGDEISFGYNGEDFGVWHLYAGKAEVQSLQVTTQASGAENATIFVNDVELTVPLTAGTVQKNAAEIAAFFQANLSGWDAQQVDDTVQIIAQSDGNKTGTFSFSSSSAAATWSEVTTGVTKTSTHIAQSQWNGVPFSDLDPTKGNTYQISYQNGFGDIEFYIQNPANGDFINVHTIRWANANTSPNMENPSLRTGLYVASEGSTTNISVECAFLAAFVTGVTDTTRNPRATDNTKTIGTTSTNILTLRNSAIYNGLVNQAEVEPRYLTLANDGAKSAIFEIRGNPTVAGTPNFQNIGTNLITDVDVAGTTVSGGRLLGKFTVAKGQSLNVNLKELEIRVPPTLRFVVSGRMVSGSAADLTASLTWLEDI